MLADEMEAGGALSLCGVGATLDSEGVLDMGWQVIDHDMPCIAHPDRPVSGRPLSSGSAFRYYYWQVIDARHGVS